MSFDKLLFCFGGDLIQLRKVNPAYLSFLRLFDDHVPTKDDRPWLWPVNIKGIDYGVPLTSHVDNAGYIGFLRCAVVPEHGLNLRYMVPVPQAALQPAQIWATDTMAELLYFETNRKYLEAEARLLHQLAGEGQLDRFWQQHSCDYLELESVYRDWQPGYHAGLLLRSKEELIKMPISKNGKLYYTEEQYRLAVSYRNALEYARSQGYELLQEGLYHKLKAHDSLVFYPDGHFIWNSRQIGNGGVLDFMVHMEGYSVPEAIVSLTENQPALNRPLQQEPSRYVHPAEPEPLRMPPRAVNYKALFAYLCGNRGLDKRVVQEMLAQNRLYQSDYSLPSGKILSNAIFVYRDNDGNTVGAYKRGMADVPGYPPYKRNAPGSDKQYGWILKAPSVCATSVSVFEAAIDAASDASIAALDKGDTWRDAPIDRLSLEGKEPQALLNYLKAHPQVQRVVLMLDADTAGREASASIRQHMEAMGYEVEDRFPPFDKDWNDVLRGYRNMVVEAQIQQSALELEFPEPTL